MFDMLFCAFNSIWGASDVVFDVLRLGQISNSPRFRGGLVVDVVDA